MTRPNIDDLDRLHGEATDGEWKPDECHPLQRAPTVCVDGRLTGGVFVCSCATSLDGAGIADAHAIAALHNTWPQVSEYIRGLEQKNEELARKCSATQSAAGLAGNVSVDRNRKNQKLETALNVAVAAVIGLDAKCRSKGIDPGDYFETVRKLADAALGDAGE